MVKDFNYSVWCNDCDVECDRENYKFICPKCKGEWWVDG